jgi:LuxR family maltose regulon positive regulatory protein
MPRSQPHLRPNTIARPRLLERLQRWQDLRLVQIVAPAGYGKTTLAGLWIQALMERPRAERPDYAWVSVDRTTDVDLFVHRITEACLPFAPALKTLLTVDGSGEYSASQRIHILCTFLKQCAHPLLLIVDDVHLLPESAVTPLLQRLLDDAPQQLHVLLLSRSHPNLQIDELILQDAVATFNAQDLTFDHDEFTRFARIMGVDDPEQASLQTLETRTGGWVTGIKLLLHDQQTKSSTAMHEPSNDDERSALAHFFESRVLDTLSSDERAFLDAGALLPWMSSNLMAAVTLRSRDECEAMLHTLIRRNLFFVPYQGSKSQRGEEVRHYLHALFQDFLQLRLTRNGDTEWIHGARMRAADWYIARQHVEAALSLLQDAVEIRSRADRIAQVLRSALLRHDMASAQRWLDHIPRDILTSHAALAVNAALYAYIAERPTLLADAERAMHTTVVLPPDESNVELRTEALILSALSKLVSKGSLAEAAQIAPMLESMPCRPDALAAGYLHLLRAWAISDAADPDRRAGLIHQAARIFEDVGFQFGAIEALISQGLVKRRSGDAAGTLASLAFAHAAIERSNWTLSYLNIISRYTYGDTLYLLNRIDEARASLQQAIDVSDIGGLLPEIAYLARISLTLCDCAQSDDPGNVKIDDDADAALWVNILRRCSPHIIGLVAIARILRDFRLSRIEGCRQTLEDLRRPLDSLKDDDPDSLRLAVLSGAILSGRSNETTRTLLERLHAHLLTADFHSMALHARVLQVLDAQVNGDADGALRILQSALPEFERTGVHRLVLDYPNLQPTLRNCDGPFAQHLLTRISTGRRPHRAFQLTPQELRITQMLCSGIGPEEIADALTLGVTTIHSHMRRIFRKMNVHSRADAVRTARDAGIVDA